MMSGMTHLSITTDCRGLRIPSLFVSSRDWTRARLRAKTVGTLCLGLILACFGAAAQSEDAQRDNAEPPAVVEQPDAAPKRASAGKPQEDSPADDAASSPLRSWRERQGRSTEETRGGDDEAQSEGGGWMGRYFLSLGVIGGLMAAVFFGLKKARGWLGGCRGGDGGTIKVVGRLPLDQRNTLFMVQVGNERLLLGGGAQSVQLLAKYPARDDDETGNEAELREDRGPSSPDRSSVRTGNRAFSSLLHPSSGEGNEP